MVRCAGQTNLAQKYHAATSDDRKNLPKRTGGGLIYCTIAHGAHACTVHPAYTEQLESSGSVWAKHLSRACVTQCKTFVAEVGRRSGNNRKLHLCVMRMCMLLSVSQDVLPPQFRLLQVASKSWMFVVVCQIYLVDKGIERSCRTLSPSPHDQTGSRTLSGWIQVCRSHNGRCRLLRFISDCATRLT